MITPWTDHKTKQALNVLSSTNNDIEKTIKFLKGYWKTVPIREEDLRNLLLSKEEELKEQEKVDIAWKNYKPFIYANKTVPASVSKARKFNRIIIPDVHHPYPDKKAWECTLGMVKDLNPAEGIIIGDFGDFQSVSKYAKNQGWQNALSAEYHSINLALDDLQNASPTTTWIYLEGNHEERCRKFMAEIGQLDGLLDVPQQLFMHASAYYRNGPLLRGMMWVGIEDQPYLTLDSAFWHGHHYSGPGAPLKNADIYSPSKCQNKPVFYGHLHTFSSATSEIGTQSTCVGFLGDEVQLDYIKAKPVPWVTGLVVQEVYGEHMSWTQIHIRNGEALMNGKLFTAHSKG